MTKTQPILNQIKSLAGTSFGHFNASNNALSSKYSIYMQGSDNDGSWGCYYQDQDGNRVADATYDASGKTSKYCIFDHTTNIKYTSSEYNTKSDKFDHIYVGDWVISDSNKNGVVDNNDAIAWVGEGDGPLTTLGDFLRQSDK